MSAPQVLSPEDFVAQQGPVSPQDFLTRQQKAAPISPQEFLAAGHPAVSGPIGHGQVSFGSQDEGNRAFNPFGQQAKTIGAEVPGGPAGGVAPGVAAAASAAAGLPQGADNIGTGIIRAASAAANKLPQFDPTTSSTSPNTASHYQSPQPKYTDTQRRAISAMMANQVEGFRAAAIGSGGPDPMGSGPIVQQSDANIDAWLKASRDPNMGLQTLQGEKDADEANRKFEAFHKFGQGINDAFGNVIGTVAANANPLGAFIPGYQDFVKATMSHVGSSLTAGVNPMTQSEFATNLITDPKGTAGAITNTINNIWRKTDMDGNPVSIDDRLDGLMLLGTPLAMKGFHILLSKGLISPVDVDAALARHIGSDAKGGGVMDNAAVADKTGAAVADKTGAAVADKAGAAVADKAGHDLAGGTFPSLDALMTEWNQRIAALDINDPQMAEKSNAIADWYHSEAAKIPQAKEASATGEIGGAPRGKRSGAGINIYNPQTWEAPAGFVAGAKNILSPIGFNNLNRVAPDVATAFQQAMGAPADIEAQWNTASRDINRLPNGTFGAKGGYFNDFVRWLTQDNLYGARGRAQGHADAINGMPDFGTQYPGSPQEGFVNHLVGDDSVQTLIDSGDHAGAKQRALDAVQGAIDPKNDVMTPEEYKAMAADPRHQQALSIWDSTVGASMTHWHAQHGGVFTDALGPGGRYIPLVREDGGPGAPAPRRLPFAAPKNTANQFRTGTGDYTVDPELIKGRISNNARRSGINNFIEKLNASGVVRPANPGETGQTTITINGLSHAATVEPTSPLLRMKGADGKWFTPKGSSPVVVPKWLQSEVGPGLGTKTEANWIRTSAGITKPFNWASVQGFTEALGHGKSVASKAFKAALGVDHPVTFVRAIFQKAGSPEWNARLSEMGKLGVLPMRTAENVLSNPSGLARYNPVYRAVFGNAGLDMRSRMAAFEVAKMVTDDPAHIRNRMNRIGTYNMALESELVRGMKQSGLNPFATSSATTLSARLSTGILNLYPNEAKGLAKIPLFVKRQVLASGMGSIGAWYVAHKAITGQTPDEKGSTLFEIPLDNLGFPGKSLNMTSLDPVAAAGFANTYGQKGRMNTQQAGGSGYQSNLAMVKDMVNSGASIVETSPAVQFGAQATLGDAPYIGSAVDDKGKSDVSLLHTGPGLPGESSNLGSALWHVNPTLGKVGEQFYGAGADWLTKDAASKSNAEKWAQVALETFIPRSVQNQSDQAKTSRFLNKQSIYERFPGVPSFIIDRAMRAGRSK